MRNNYIFVNVLWIILYYIFIIYIFVTWNDKHFKCNVQCWKISFLWDAYFWLSANHVLLYNNLVPVFPNENKTLSWHVTRNLYRLGIYLIYIHIHFTYVFLLDSERSNYYIFTFEIFCVALNSFIWFFKSSNLFSFCISKSKFLLYNSDNTFFIFNTMEKYNVIQNLKRNIIIVF